MVLLKFRIVNDLKRCEQRWILIGFSLVIRRSEHFLDSVELFFDGDRLRSPISDRWCFGHLSGSNELFNAGRDGHGGQFSKGQNSETAKNLFFGLGCWWFLLLQKKKRWRVNNLWNQKSVQLRLISPIDRLKKERLCELNGSIWMVRWFECKMWEQSRLNASLISLSDSSVAQNARKKQPLSEKTLTSFKTFFT